MKNPQIGFYTHDLVIVAILLYWLGKKIFLKEKLLVKGLGRVGRTVLAFSVVASLSFLLNSFKRSAGEMVIAGLYLLRWISYVGLYFVVRERHACHPEVRSNRNEGSPANAGSGICQRFFAGAQNDDRVEFTKLLIAAGFIAAVFGLLQYVFYPDIRPLTVFEWDPHYYRIVGTFLEPGFVGLIYVLGMILIICHCWSKKIKVKFTNYYLLITIYYLAFALTYSRSSYLAYLLAMVAVAYFKKSFRFFVAVLLIFALTLAVLPRPGGEGVKLERKASILSRFRNWREAIVIAQDNPFLGIGFNFYRYAARDYKFLGKKDWQYSHAGAGADNSFLFVLSTTGIVGLFFYLRMVLEILKSKSLPVFVSTIAIATHALFNNSLFYPWVMIWFWIMLGVYGV